MKLKRYFSYLSLLLSTGTLVCCVVPTFLVLLGMGAIMASLAINFQWLISLSEYKFWLLLASGVILLAFHWFIDEQPVACENIRHEKNRKQCSRYFVTSKRLMSLSEIMWCTSFIIGYLILPISFFIDNIV